ncbi:hypothetical protein ABE196_19015 [Bacillus subtilis]
MRRKNAVIRNEKLESRRVVQLFSEIVYEDISKRKYPPTLIFNDPDDLFFHASSVQLRNLGYDVYHWKESRLESSFSYNPLEKIVEQKRQGNEDVAAGLIREVVDLIRFEKNTTFNFEESRVFTLILEALVEESAAQGKHLSLCDLKIDKSHLESIPAIKEVGESILAGISARFDGVNYHSISKSTITLEEIGYGERPVAIFMSKSESNLIQCVQSMWINDLYRAIALKRMNNRNPCNREIIITLRDFCEMHPIPNIDIMTCISVGSQIYFNFLVDSLEELTEKYGENTAQRIAGNCVGPAGIDFLTYFSQKA